MAKRIKKDNPLGVCDFSFTLGMVEWKVKFVRSVPTEDDRANLGLTMPDEQTIYVSKKLSNHSLITTLYHEIVHASLATLPEGQPLNEELVAELVSAALFQIWMQMPSLPEFMRGHQPPKGVESVKNEIV